MLEYMAHGGFEHARVYGSIRVGLNMLEYMAQGGFAEIGHLHA